MFSNIKYLWLSTFALNALFAIVNIIFILISNNMWFFAACGLFNAGLAVHALYKWSILE